jgi:cytosine/adenosine deaminase-related metal-dependent hydrolase
VIDLRAHTCMPGLIDLHVHLDNNLTPASFVEQFTLNPTDHAIARWPTPRPRSWRASRRFATSGATGV